MTVWTAIGAFLMLCVPLLQAWLANAPTRTKEAQDAEIQKVRAAIAAGNVVVLNSSVDGLLPDGGMPTKGTTSDSVGQQHSADSTAQGIHDLLGTEIVLR